MAEPRQKSHSILLTIKGKVTLIELFEAALWPECSSAEDEFRLRIAGKWHCPLGKYSFLTFEAVGVLVASLLAGEGVPNSPRPDMEYGDLISAGYGEVFQGVPLETVVCRVVYPPHLGIDGRWYVWVNTPDGQACVLVDDCKMLEKRRRR